MFVTVKNIPIRYPIKEQGISFVPEMERFMGQKIEVTPVDASPNNRRIVDFYRCNNGVYGYWWHKSWLEFNTPNDNIIKINEDGTCG